MHNTIGFDVPEVLLKSFEMSDFEGRDYVLLEVAKYGLATYEYPLPNLLVSYLSRHRGTFFDIGANTGLYTLLAAATCGDVEVCAFEPLGDIHARLEANVALNPSLAPRIRCAKVALSNRSGTAAFFETVNDQGFLTTSSSLEETHAKSMGTRYVLGEVETRTLDDWIESNPFSSPSVMKIDVEGHEAMVIAGASRFFSIHRPLLFVEMLAGTDFDFFANFSVANGYVNFEIEPTRLRMRADFRFNALAWNHALCPTEKIYALVVAARQAGLEIT